jgi:hypothetical protein
VGVVEVVRRDPGSEEAVGMVDEVVSDEHGEALAIAVEVGRSDRDQLAISGRGGRFCGQ